MCVRRTSTGRGENVICRGMPADSYLLVSGYWTACKQLLGIGCVWMCTSRAHACDEGKPVHKNSTCVKQHGDGEGPHEGTPKGHEGTCKSGGRGGMGSVRET
jgi:hypothetical protein